MKRRSTAARLRVLGLPFVLAGSSACALLLLGHVSGVPAGAPWYSFPPTPLTGNDPIVGLAASHGSPSYAGFPTVLTATYSSGAFTAPYSATALTLDSACDTGWDSASVSDGHNLLISYYNATTGDLKLARCHESNCEATLITPTLDSAADVGRFSSLAMDSESLAYFISYYDATNGDLKLAQCPDTTCGSVIRHTVDVTGEVGLYTSLGLMPPWAPPIYAYISYYDATQHDLKLARCLATNCASPDLLTLDSAGDVGQYTSLMLDTDYLPAITYYDATNGDLRLARCQDAACSIVATRTLDSAGDVGRFSSLAIGADGPIVSYYDATNQDLKFAKCDDASCSSVTLRTVDSAGNVGQFSSLTHGADFLPIISYYDSGSQSIKVAHCEDNACSSASLATFDSAGAPAMGTTIVFGTDGLPFVAYYAAGALALKLAHGTGGIKMTWDYGDGSPLGTLIGPPSGAPSEHVYASAGVYTAVVTATNKMGSAFDTTVITVMPVADLRLALAVTPTTAVPGQALTYTLAYSNAGQLAATGVFITDSLPAGLSLPSYTASGAVITPSAGITYAWQVADLPPGAGGLITISAQVAGDLAGVAAITNTASITGTAQEPLTGNNVALAAGAAYPLTVTLAGAGSGTVSSSPPGIICGVDCGETFAFGTAVTLTATPAGTSLFGGWSAPCVGIDPCVLDVQAVLSVTATFTAGYQIFLAAIFK